MSTTKTASSTKEKMESFPAELLNLKDFRFPNLYQDSIANPPVIPGNLRGVHQRNPTNLASLRYPQWAKVHRNLLSFDKQTDSVPDAERFAGYRYHWATRFLLAEVGHRNHCRNHGWLVVPKLLVLLVHPNMPKIHHLQLSDIEIHHNNSSKVPVEAIHSSLHRRGRRGALSPSENDYFQLSSVPKVRRARSETLVLYPPLP